MLRTITIRVGADLPDGDVQPRNSKIVFTRLDTYARADGGFTWSITPDNVTVPVEAGVAVARLEDGFWRVREWWSTGRTLYVHVTTDAAYEDLEIVDPATLQPMDPVPPSAQDILVEAGAARDVAVAAGDSASVDAAVAEAARVAAAVSAAGAGTAAATAATAAVAPVAANLVALEAGLPATIGTVTASDMGNPETALNGATVDVVEQVLGGGVSGLMRIVDARGVPSTPRPAGWAGAVLWKINDGESNPLNYNFALGDMIAKVETAPVDFDPSQIPGVVVYLDARSLVGVYTQGQELTSWPNLIDGFPDALPIAAGVGPTFAAAGINGGPAVLWDGVSGGLAISGLAPYSGPMTVYLVAISSPGTTTGTDFFYDGRTAAVASLQRALGRNATNNWIVYSGDNFTKTGANNTLHLFRVDYGNPTSTLTVGGTSQSGTTNDGPVITGLSVGSRADGLNALDGVIGMLVVIEGTVDTDTNALVTAYALAKYGAS